MTESWVIELMASILPESVTMMAAVTTVNYEQNGRRGLWNGCKILSEITETI